MNTLGLLLVWTALQVTLFCLAGMALYLLARRRHPATGAWTVSAVLCMAIGISALSISPWPQWWSVNDETRGAQPSVKPDAVAAENERPASATPEQPPAAEINSLSAIGNSTAKHNALDLWTALLVAFRANAMEITAPLATPQWRWPAWLACAMLGGMGLGCLRLLVGLGAVAHYRRHTQVVSEANLCELLVQIRAELHCARPIELREFAISTLCSAATVGWLRPFIVLPGDWRLWSERERRAILAHEVAHVVHHDFACWLVAQAGVVLNFYNPLVHWLASRLRLEQEMAADLCGATAAGGAQSYLTVLAQMALRQDQATTLWAGRPFLPTRGTLMRRIEMLHNPRYRFAPRPSRARRAALAAIVAAAGCLVAGLRGPTGIAWAESSPADQPAPTAQKPADKPATSVPFDISYVPSDAKSVVSFRVPELAKSPWFGEYLKSTEKELREMLQVSLFDIEEIKLLPLMQFKELKSAGPDGERHQLTISARMLILRARVVLDWPKLMQVGAKAFFNYGPKEEESAAKGPTAATVHDRTYYRFDSPVSLCYYIPDERTCVITQSQKEMERLLAADPSDRPAWFEEWQEASKSALAVAAIPRENLGDKGIEGMGPIPPVAHAFIKHTDLLFATVDCPADGIEINFTGHCASPEGAQELTSMAKLLLATMSSLPEDRQNPAEVLTAEAFSKIHVTAEASDVKAEAKIGAELIAKMMAAEKVETARRAEEKKQTIQTKLSRLVAALKEYRTAHGHYPESAVMGPDGKTTHSWRVELLPFLGEQKLYERYQLDEPWDSEHNKPLLDEAPAAFTVHENSKQRSADFYLVPSPITTKDTVITADLILLVEMQSSCPWTKPQDLEIDANKEPPKLTGHVDGGFFAAFADGSIRFVPDTMDKDAVWAILYKPGLEAVQQR